MMQEDRRRRPAEQPAEQDLAAGGLEQVLAPDHQVHAVPEVVHHHGELVGPLPEPVAQQQVAALRRRVLRPARRAGRPSKRSTPGSTRSRRPSPGAGVRPRSGTGRRTWSPR